MGKGAMTDQSPIKQDRRFRKEEESGQGRWERRRMHEEIGFFGV